MKNLWRRYLDVLFGRLIPPVPVELGNSGLSLIDLNQGPQTVEFDFHCTNCGVPGHFEVKIGKL